jgi:hypothetical protein
MKNQQTSQPLQQFSLFETKKIVEFLASIGALPLLVLIHEKVGLRTLRASKLIGIAMFMWFLAGLANLNILIFKPAGSLFDGLPWLILGAGFFQRRRRWAELERGEMVHSFSPGVSYLEKLPFPAYLKAHSRLTRFVEPAACFICSMLIGLFVSVAVARLFALASIALAIYQQALYEARLEADLNTLDSLLESEAHNETVKFFAEPQANQQERFIENAIGTSTGVDFNLSRQIEKLRAKQAKAQDSKPV